MQDYTALELEKELVREGDLIAVAGNSSEAVSWISENRYFFKKTD